jgi:hypothetical protein
VIVRELFANATELASILIMDAPIFHRLLWAHIHKAAAREKPTKKTLIPVVPHKQALFCAQSRGPANKLMDLISISEIFTRYLNCCHSSIFVLCLTIYFI